MKQYIKSVITFTALAISCGSTRAQDVCVIKGHIDNTHLQRSNRNIEKVYLAAIDEFDRPITKDSALINGGNFEFKHHLAKGEPSLIYLIRGFDNGDVPLFVEPGTVNVAIKNASYPTAATVTGTANNDLYNEYKAIAKRCARRQIDTLNVLRNEKGGDQWMDSTEGKETRMQIGASELILCMADQIDFLLNHNYSPLAPLIMEKELYYNFDKFYAKRLLGTLAPSLKQHPYYRSYSNTVKALDLKTGSELPDITLPLANGSRTTLNNFKGKYILLDFWASWCGPCRKEIPNLVRLFDDTQAQRDKFTIISFSLDDKEKDWKDAIQTLDMNKEGWIHASDLLAWGSPAARMLGVEAIPKAILIDPDGRAISFSLRGEELVNRVKQIMSGDLYYQNTQQDDSSELSKIRMAGNK